MATLTPIWSTKTETATRIRQRKGDDALVFKSSYKAGKPISDMTMTADITLVDWDDAITLEDIRRQYGETRYINHIRGNTQSALRHCMVLSRREYPRNKFEKSQ